MNKIDKVSLILVRLSGWRIEKYEFSGPNSRFNSGHTPCVLPQKTVTLLLIYFRKFTNRCCYSMLSTNFVRPNSNSFFLVNRIEKFQNKDCRCYTVRKLNRYASNVDILVLAIPKFRF